MGKENIGSQVFLWASQLLIQSTFISHQAQGVYKKSSSPNIFKLESFRMAVVSLTETLMRTMMFIILILYEVNVINNGNITAGDEPLM